MESFEQSGMWWFPGHDNQAVAGDLTFDPASGGDLEIQDSLLTQLDDITVQDRRDFAAFERVPDRIYGRTRDGTVITLEGIQYSGFADTSLMDGTRINSEEYTI